MKTGSLFTIGALVLGLAACRNDAADHRADRADRAVDTTAEQRRDDVADRAGDHFDHHISAKGSLKDLAAEAAHEADLATGKTPFERQRDQRMEELRLRHTFDTIAPTLADISRPHLVLNAAQRTDFQNRLNAVHLRIREAAEAIEILQDATPENWNTFEAAATAQVERLDDGVKSLYDFIEDAPKAETVSAR